MGLEIKTESKTALLKIKTVNTNKTTKKTLTPNAAVMYSQDKNKS